MKAKLQVVPAINKGAPAKLPIAAPQFLTVAEVADLLRMKPKGIYKMVQERRIPFRKAGAQLLFDVAEIDAWTKSNANNQ